MRSWCLVALALGGCTSYANRTFDRHCVGAAMADVVYRDPTPKMLSWIGEVFEAAGYDRGLPQGRGLASRWWMRDGGDASARYVAELDWDARKRGYHVTIFYQKRTTNEVVNRRDLVTERMEWDVLRHADPARARAIEHCRETCPADTARPCIPACWGRAP
jgi:hypothetical protein